MCLHLAVTWWHGALTPSRGSSESTVHRWRVKAADPTLATGPHSQTVLANDKLRGSEQLLSTWRLMHRLRSICTQINFNLNFGVTWIFFRAEAGGSLASRYYGMLHIAPDIGDAVCPGKTPDIVGCLCTYMNLLYSISWSISKFFTSMYVYEFCGFDIVPDIEEKASI